MEFIYTSRCLDHRTGSHPECPDRMRSFSDLSEHSLPSGFDFLSLVHTKEHVRTVQDACSQQMPLNNDTITSSGSYLAALAAVGASITAAEQGGFALIRPPGHHAYPHKSTGFCFFNNIAIATRHLTEQGKKVFILDFDGHLGDGTSHIFYDDPQVLFCSLHQFPAFPGNGWIDEIGTGSGTGYNINIPMPPASGDDLFWQAMKLVLKIAQEFQPEVVAVSAGFDGHISDPLLQLRYSLTTYYQCGVWLRDHFQNVFALLEGGYNLEFLPKAIWNFIDGYNNKPQQFPEITTTSSPQVTEKFNKNLLALKELLKPHWSI